MFVNISNLTAAEVKRCLLYFFRFSFVLVHWKFACISAGDFLCGQFISVFVAVSNFNRNFSIVDEVLNVIFCTGNSFSQQFLSRRLSISLFVNYMLA